MTLRIIALRPGGALGNPSKILQVLQDPQQTPRKVHSQKFVVFQNKQKDMILVIGYDIHPLIAKHVAPHVGEGYQVSSGGKITYYPAGKDNWEAVLGGWSTTYTGPPTPDLLHHSAEITKTLGMTVIFRWEIEQQVNGKQTPIEDPGDDLALVR